MPLIPESNYVNDLKRNSYKKTPKYADQEMLRSVRNAYYLESNLLLLCAILAFYFVIFNYVPSFQSKLLYNIFGFPLELNYSGSSSLVIYFVSLGLFVAIYLYPILYKYFKYWQFFEFTSYSNKRSAKFLGYFLFFWPAAWYLKYIILKDLDSYEYYLQNKEALTKESHNKTKYVMLMGWSSKRGLFVDTNELDFSTPIEKSHQVRNFLSCHPKKNYVWKLLWAKMILRLILVNLYFLFGIASIINKEQLGKIRPEIDFSPVNRLFNAILGLSITTSVIIGFSAIWAQAKVSSLLFLSEKLNIYYYMDQALIYQVFFLNNVFAYHDFAKYQKLICKIWEEKGNFDYFSEEIKRLKDLKEAKKIKNSVPFWNPDR